MAKRKKRRLAFHGAREVRRTTFDGLPIVDAKANFTLVVRTRDVEAAKGSERDASNCILAKACAKQVGASTVAFFRRTAYLELPDSKGKRRVVRFMLDKNAAAIVSAFDRGKSVKGEVTVTLRKPSRSQSLDSVRENNSRRKERQRKAILSGEIIGDASKARFHKMPRIADMDVRSGIGMVHNTLKKEKQAVTA